MIFRMKYIRTSNQNTKVILLQSWLKEGIKSNLIVRVFIKVTKLEIVKNEFGIPH